VNNGRSDLPGLLRSLPVSVWLFTGLWLFLSAYWQWLVHSNGILGDMWDILPGYQQLPVMGFGEFWHELTAQFAQVHVLAVPKLFFWINFAFFGGSGSFLKFFSFLFCIANGLLLLALLAKERPESMTSTGFFLCLLLVHFNGFQTLVIDWDFLLQHYLAVFFSLCAFLAYERGRSLALVLLLIAFAGVSCGSGLSSLISVGFLLIVRRETGIKLLCFVFFAAVLLLVLWPEPQVLPPSMQNIASNPFFPTAPSLLLQYLGFPVTAWCDARWLGLLPFTVALLSCYRCIRRADTPVTDFLICYFFLIACSVVWGRYRYFAPDTDLSRFFVYMAPLWFLVLLRIGHASVLLFRAFTVLWCAVLALGGLAAVAVASDHAGRMELSRVVALNGNFTHYAGLRLNAMLDGKNALQDNAGYLQAQGMDVYYRRRVSIAEMPDTGSPCAIKLLRMTRASKGQYRDYFFKTTDARDGVLTALYAADAEGKVLYYGVVVAAANRLHGWTIPLRSVRLQDWSLLLPVAWLSAENVLIYTHLPRNQEVTTLDWWAERADGKRCRVVMDFTATALNPASVSVAPE
jgi:hypothetical protein